MSIPRHDLNTLDRVDPHSQGCFAAVHSYRFGEVPEVYLDTHDEHVGSYLRTSATESFGVYASVPSTWVRAADDDDADAAVMLVVPHSKRAETQFHVLFADNDLLFLHIIATLGSLCLVSTTVSDLRLIVEFDREGLQQVLDEIG